MNIWLPGRGELVAVKQSLLSLAQETVGAIKQLKDQMLSLKKAVCCGHGSEDKAPVQSLDQVCVCACGCGCGCGVGVCVCVCVYVYVCGS